MGAIGRNEIRVVIQPGSAGGAQADAVPAAVYKKLFDAVLGALLTADRELHAKSGVERLPRRASVGQPMRVRIGRKSPRRPVRTTARQSVFSAAAPAAFIEATIRSCCSIVVSCGRSSASPRPSIRPMPSRSAITTPSCRSTSFSAARSIASVLPTRRADGGHVVRRGRRSPRSTAGSKPSTIGARRGAGV